MDGNEFWLYKEKKIERERWNILAIKNKTNVKPVHKLVITSHNQKIGRECFIELQYPLSRKRCHPRLTQLSHVVITSAYQQN